jgi:hypothetical protein
MRETNKMKAPVAGSRKAQVYDVFHDKGLDAAIKKALSLGLKEGTVRSWAGGWSKAPRTEHSTDNRPQRGGAPIARKAKAPDKGPAEFSPHFQHKSKGDAAKHILNIVRRSGCAEAAYHIIEQDGRFAVAPAHYKPGGPIPQFKDGDIVFDTIIPNQKGKVVKAGPEVCEVKGPDGIRAIPNYYLYKFVDESKPKRERIKDEPPAKKKIAREKPAKPVKKGKCACKRFIVFVPQELLTTLRNAVTTSEQVTC